MRPGDESGPPHATEVTLWEALAYDRLLSDFLPLMTEEQMRDLASNATRIFVPEVGKECPRSAPLSLEQWGRRRARGSAETRVVQTILHPTGGQCKGNPVGCPWGCGARTVAALGHMRLVCTTVAGRSTAMESPLPGAGRDDRRREPSEVARRQDPPSPGAARRPLPARERRLFVASLGTGRSFLSARSTKPTLPAGHVGATRWVARRGRGGRAPALMRGRRAQSHQGDAPRRPYMHHRIHPHPALRAGLSLAGRGVSLLLRWEQTAAFCPLPQRSKPFRQAM
jgi:hypothetical protein